MLGKPKEKPNGTYLNLIEFLLKQVILYACECWGDSMKKNFANKFGQFHLSMCKKMIGVQKFTNNIKVLSEVGRTPLDINIETKMLKYFQRFPFIETNRYLLKPSKKNNLIQKAGFRI